MRVAPDTTRKLYFENRTIKPVFRKVVKSHWTLKTTILAILTAPRSDSWRHTNNMKILESEEKEKVY